MCENKHEETRALRKLREFSVFDAILHKNYCKFYIHLFAKDEKIQRTLFSHRFWCLMLLKME